MPLAFPLRMILDALAVFMVGMTALPGTDLNRREPALRQGLLDPCRGDPIVVEFDARYAGGADFGLDDTGQGP